MLKKGYILNSILILVSFIVSLVILEFVSRFMCDRSSRRFIHPYIGETYKTNYRKWTRSPTGEKYLFKLNRIGFRGPELPLKKKPNDLYIFVLGGSTTACNEFHDSLTWPGILQGKLDSVFYKHRVFVFNGGFGGASSFHSCQILQHVVINHHPDLVLVYHALNDILPTLQPPYSPNLGEIGKGKYLYRTSYFLRILYDLFIGKPGFYSEQGSQNKEEVDYNFHLQNYLNVVGICQIRNIPLSLITQKIALNETDVVRTLQDNPVYKRFIFDSYENYLPIQFYPEVLDSLNRQTEEICNSTCLCHLIDLAKMLPYKKEFYLPDNIHYSANGNRILAEIIFTELLQSNPYLLELFSSYEH